MKQTVDTKLVIEVAHDVIEQVEPDELLLFPSISESYARKPERILKQRVVPGKSASFGPLDIVEQVALFVFYVLHQAVVQDLIHKAVDQVSTNVIDTVEKGAWSRLKQLFKRKDAQPTSTAQPRGQEYRLDQIHKIAKESAEDFNIPPEKAQDIADKIIARLVLARIKSEQEDAS